MEKTIVLRDTIYDTITVKQTVIDTIYLNYDSATVALLEKTKIFYSNSFSELTSVIGIVLASIGLIIGIPSLWNYWKGKKYNKDMKIEVENIKKETESLKTELKSEINAQIEAQQKSFNEKLDKQKNEFNNLKADQEVEFKSTHEDILRELRFTYFNLAIENASNIQAIDANNNVIVWQSIVCHFYYLGVYFSFFEKYKIELDEFDLGTFNMINDKFIIRYKSLDIELFKDRAIKFLRDFYKFMQYCKESKQESYFADAEKIWKEFAKIYGGEDLLLKDLK